MRPAVYALSGTTWPPLLLPSPCNSSRRGTTELQVASYLDSMFLRPHAHHLPVVSCLQPLVCTAAYILGEFGRLIPVTAQEQFQLLHACFPNASPLTKGV